MYGISVPHSAFLHTPLPPPPPSHLSPLLLLPVLPAPHLPQRKHASGTPSHLSIASGQNRARLIASELTATGAGPGRGNDRIGQGFRFQGRGAETPLRPAGEPAGAPLLPPGVTLPFFFFPFLPFFPRFSSSHRRDSSCRTTTFHVHVKLAGDPWMSSCLPACLSMFWPFAKHHYISQICLSPPLSPTPGWTRRLKTAVDVCPEEPIPHLPRPPVDLRPTHALPTPRPPRGWMARCLGL